MRLTVLAAADSWYVTDLKRAAGSKHVIDVRSFTQLQDALPPVADERTARIADHGDAVLVRSMPAGSLEQIVFRMDVLGEWFRRGVPVVNQPRALEIAIDKFLASSRLAKAGVAVPRTVVCQQVDQAMQAFEHLGGDVVIKPLFGSEGRGLVRVTDVDVAWRVLKALEQTSQVLYLQEFIPHQGFDHRVLVVGERMWAIRRTNANDWRTNISRGGHAEPAALTDELQAIARVSAEAVGAEIAGVDVLTARDGRPFVLEVNAVPGWRALVRVLETDIAAEVLKYVDSLRTAAAASLT